MNGILNLSIHFNVVHRKVDWRNPKMKSLNSMPVQGRGSTNASRGAGVRAQLSPRVLISYTDKQKKHSEGGLNPLPPPLGSATAL